MKTLYESILDDEDVLINNANNNIKGKIIYDKIINKEQLTKTNLDWINNKVGVYEVNKDELVELINVIKKEKKYHKLSLNWLDVSKVKNMSWMFAFSDFNIDISKWDVSKVEDMSYMFYESKFNGDIFNWDVSKVKNMSWMFYNAKFNGDISKWDISEVRDMSYMFSYSPFNGDISKWDISEVRDMSFMFSHSPFNRDISKWEISSKCNIFNIFIGCPIKDKYKPKNIK